MELNYRDQEFPFHRYVFDDIGTNMYVFPAEDMKEAIVVDPHISEAAVSFLKKRKTEKILILLTHEHYDHTSGVNFFCEQFRSLLYCQRFAAESIALEKNNRPLVVSMLLKDLGKTEKLKELLGNQKLYKCKADIVFDEQLVLEWGRHKLRFVHTPGHSPGSCCIEFDDEYVLTGDSLIPNTKIITRFPGGSEETFRQMTLEYLKAIPEHIWILPGHEKPIRKSDLNYRDDMFVIKDTR